MTILISTAAATLLVAAFGAITLLYIRSNHKKVWRMARSRRRFIAAAVIAALVSGSLTGAVTQERAKNISPQKGLLIFSASLAKLPHLAELYATTNGELYFYNQGDLAYALATAETNKTEITKYKTLLRYLLEGDKEMHAASKANLYYSSGKINLLLNEHELAIKDFRQAYAENRQTVEAKIKIDSGVRDYLIVNGVY